MKPIAIGIDLGGTRVKLGLTDPTGIIAQTEFESHSGSGFISLLKKVEQEINVLVHNSRYDISMVEGIGISIPGIVDTHKKQLLSVNKKYADAVDFDFANWANERFNLKMAMDNDARCALLGEWQYGAGIGYDDIVMVTLGTGIGGAALIDGKLLRGKHYQAGCLCGHFVIDYKGPECTCGNVGCIEAVASSWRLPSIVREQEGFKNSLLAQCKSIDFKALFEAAANNDNVANKVVDKCLQAWSAGITTMIHAYDPETVIIGGGIMASADTILPYIQKHINKHAWTPWGNVEVLKAQHGGWSSMLGAGYLALESNEK